MQTLTHACMHIHIMHMCPHIHTLTHNAHTCMHITHIYTALICTHYHNSYKCMHIYEHTMHTCTHMHTHIDSVYTCTYSGHTCIYTLTQGLWGWVSPLSVPQWWWGVNYAGQDPQGLGVLEGVGEKHSLKSKNSVKQYFPYSTLCGHLCSNITT